MSTEDWAGFFFVGTQALFLPILIAYLSLRIRRGALPAGIAIVTAANVFTVVLLEVSHRRSSDATILATMAIVSGVMTTILALMTYRAIPKAGAAE